MNVVTVETDDVAGYASFVGELNKTWAAEGTDMSGSVYVPGQAGEAVRARGSGSSELPSSGSSPYG